MNTPLLNARVAPEVVAELDTLAAERGVNRSDLVREAIAQLLEANQATRKSKGRR